MIRFLVVISIVFFTSVPCLSAVSNSIVAESQLVEDTIARQYNVVIDARGKQITGLCMIEVQSNGNLVGTMVNEFGVKAFDFTRKNGRIKLRNVFQKINKWYIRRVLRKDMEFLFDNISGENDVSKGKRHFRKSTDGELIVTNEKYKLTYTLQEIEP